MVRFLLTITVISIALSCKVTQKYSTPADAASGKLYRDVSTTDTTTIANLSWKELFTDPSLQKLIDEGIQNNLDLKVAVARIRSATASAKQSKLAFYPTLGANGQAVFQHVPDPAFGLPQTFELFLSSGWEADIWGKLKSAKRAALANLLQSDAYRRAVQTQLVADIATNYYLLLAYDAQLQITQQTIANRVQEVETMKTLKESNVVTGAAVVQAAANRYSVEITVPDLKRNIRETENTLSVLLGRSPDSILRTAIEQQTVSSNLATGVPTQMLAHRPDVQQAEFGLRNAFELVNVARTYFYPQFTITASAGLSGTTFAQLFSPSTFFANLTGNLFQPIFQQGLNEARLESAKARQDENFAVFRKTILVAGQEVSDALYSYNSAVEKQNLRAEQISFLQKSVDYTKELLKYSSATNYTDVLTSEQSLLAAQLNSVNDKLQQLTAMVSLYRSLGGGWK